MPDNIPMPEPMIGSLARLTEIETLAAQSGLDWQAAIDHVIACRAPYLDAPNHAFASYQLVIEHVYRPLLLRYHRGERTPALHAEMIALR